MATDGEESKKFVEEEEVDYRASQKLADEESTEAVSTRGGIDFIDAHLVTEVEGAEAAAELHSAWGSEQGAPVMPTGLSAGAVEVLRQASTSKNVYTGAPRVQAEAMKARSGVGNGRRGSCQHIVRVLVVIGQEYLHLLVRDGRRRCAEPVGQDRQ